MMTKERLLHVYNVDIDKLNWQTGWNGLFQYVDFGRFTLYHDGTGYYVTDETNSVYGWTVDLSKYATHDTYKEAI